MAREDSNGPNVCEGCGTIQSATIHGVTLVHNYPGTSVTCHQDANRGAPTDEER